MKTRQAEERKHEIKVGLTILAALVILVFAILSVGQQRGLLEDRYKLRVLMSRINGLQTGAPVRLAGVRVGSVVNVQFSGDMENKKIEVVLEIDKSVQSRIREDSEAHIGTLGLLGDKFVGITMGSIDKRILEHGEELKGSDPLDLEQLLDDGVALLDDVKNTVRSLDEIATKVNHGDGTLGLLVNDPRIYFDLDQLLILTSRLNKKLAEGSGTLARLLDDSTLYVSANHLLNQSALLADSLRLGRGSASQLLRNPELYDELLETSIRLNKFTQQLEEGKGTLGQTVNNPDLYRRMVRITASLDSLITDVRRNPQRYLKVEIF